MKVMEIHTGKDIDVEDKIMWGEAKGCSASDM